MMLLVNDPTLKTSAVNRAHGISALWLQFVCVIGSPSRMNSFINYVAMELEDGRVDLLGLYVQYESKRGRCG
jgi:hypothetical protein